MAFGRPLLFLLCATFFLAIAINLAEGFDVVCHSEGHECVPGIHIGIPCCPGSDCIGQDDEGICTKTERNWFRRRRHGKRRHMAAQNRAQAEDNN